MIRQVFFLGRPTLTPVDSEGGRQTLSTRRLVLGCRLPSRPQERFRTWPRLIRLGDLEGIIFDKAGQIRTEQIPLHGHATITGVDGPREPFLVFLPAETGLRSGRRARVEFDDLPTGSFSLAGQETQKQTRRPNTD